LAGNWTNQDGDWLSWSAVFQEEVDDSEGEKEGKKKEGRQPVLNIPKPGEQVQKVPPKGEIPPPTEKPEQKISQEPKPDSKIPSSFESIPEPRHVDDLEIPVPKTESSVDTMELPTLEFPTLPKEDKHEYPYEEERPVVTPINRPFPKKPVPSEIPPIKTEEKKEVPPKIIPKIEEPKEEELVKEQPEEAEEQLKLFPKVEVKHPSEEAEKIKPKTRYDDVSEPKVIRDEKGPLFIDIENFKRIHNTLDETQTKMKALYIKSQKMNTTKNKEDSQIEALQSSVENMQRKLVFMDKLIFENQEGD